MIKEGGKTILSSVKRKKENWRESYLDKFLSYLNLIPKPYQAVKTLIISNSLCLFQTHSLRDNPYPP